MIKSYPHLTFCNTAKEVFDKLDGFLNKNITIDVSKKLFKYVDSNNSKRLVEWMKSH